MKAMILAAGRGERLKPLTVITPKPLLMVGNTTLLGHLLHQLRDAGIEDVVINVHHHADQMMAYAGDGSQFGLRIQYSVEEVLLETGGGIYQALPLLGCEPFLIISADIWTDYPLENLIHKKISHAHLVLVSNPDFHIMGDFNLSNEGVIQTDFPKKFTYASFGILHPDLFRHALPGIFRLTDVLQPAIENGLVTGEHYQGHWHNVGTLDELTKLRSTFMS